MKNRNYDWNLNINKDFGLSCQDEFMNNQRIKDECKCVEKNTCLLICDLFSNNKYNEAINVLDSIKNKYD